MASKCSKCNEEIGSLFSSGHWKLYKGKKYCESCADKIENQKNKKEENKEQDVEQFYSGKTCFECQKKISKTTLNYFEFEHDEKAYFDEMFTIDKNDSYPHFCSIKCKGIWIKREMGVSIHEENVPQKQKGSNGKESYDLESLPNELIAELLQNEDVFYFSYISYQGGCFSTSSRDEYWIALTNKRVIYLTKVMDINGRNHLYTKRHGIMPFEKISFIEIKELQQQGCNSVKEGYGLEINTSGGGVLIPLPTKEKGYEIRKMYGEIYERKKNEK